jgi:hemoglobin-like flavoprotein
MTPHQIRLVQESYATAATLGADKVAQLFYARLFEIEPTLRPLFKDDMTEQRQKLMQMLTAAVQGLHNFNALRPALASLGERHRGYGVKPKHYDMVGAALLHTLATGLGDAFNPEVKEAWTICYGLVAREMLSSQPVHAGGTPSS